jgi:hypothetical protein
MSVVFQRQRSRAVTSAALGVAAMGVLLSAGVTSAAMAQPLGNVAVRQAPAATFTWHKLTLINGWQTGADKRPPSYAIKGGVVYLTGTLQQPVSGSSEFAILPTAARPSHTLYRTVYTYGLTTGTLYILPDGIIEAYSKSVAAAQVYTALAGVSYPVSGFTWHQLSLLHGWKSAQTPFNTGSPAYAVKGGVVYLSGSLTQATGTNRELAVLPKSARPAHKMKLLVYTYSDTVGTLVVYANGEMFASSSPAANARSFTSLAAISYPATGTTWHRLTLSNGWQQGLDGSGNPAYAIIGGVVYLSGSLQETSGTSSSFGLLPAATRPSDYLAFAVFTSGGTNGTFQLASNGGTDANSNPFDNAQDFTSLAAISYPRSA